MTDTNHTSFITSLIEQRIREEVRDAGNKAVNEFQARLEADIEKLGLHLPMAVRAMVEMVRTKHIDSLANKRIVELVERLVQVEQTPAQGEPATATAFQVGDQVMLKSGGPVMTVTHVRDEAKLTCTWPADGFAAFKDFPQQCLTRARIVRFNPVRS